MKKYEILKILVCNFDVADIVRTSGVDPAGADENWVTLNFVGGEDE